MKQAHKKMPNRKFYLPADAAKGTISLTKFGFCPDKGEGKFEKQKRLDSKSDEKDEDYQENEGEGDEHDEERERLRVCACEQCSLQ